MSSKDLYLHGLLRTRGRRVHMTDTDAAEFLEVLVAIIPGVRLFYPANLNANPFIEASLGDAMERWSEGTCIRPIFNPDWQPAYGPDDYPPYEDTLINDPSLSMNLSSGSIRTVEFEDIRKTIRVSNDGSPTLTNDKDDPEGKRVVDKILRLHRKMVSKDVQVIDLRTGKRVDADYNCDWYGPDMARKCQEEDDLYLAISAHPDFEERWGIKPAD